MAEPKGRLKVGSGLVEGVGEPHIVVCMGFSLRVPMIVTNAASCGIRRSGGSRGASIAATAATVCAQQQPRTSITVYSPGFFLSLQSW